jgi:hypothetical protein
VDFLSVALFSYSLVYVSLNFEKVWTHMGNGIRVSFDAFLVLLLAYVSRDTPPDKAFFFILFAAAFVSTLFLTPIL